MPPRIMAGGGFSAGHIHGATDEFGYTSVENRVSVPDLHATILNQLGIDHTKLTFTHSGRPERLTDPDVTGMVNEREIYFIPMVNPDGHVYVEANHSGGSDGWWRKNRRNNGNGTFGVDLNRNYGYRWGYDDVGSSPTTSSGIYRRPSAFSEPETQAVRQFAAGRHFTMWLSYVRPRQRPVTNVVAVVIIALTFFPILPAYYLTRADEPGAR